MANVKTVDKRGQDFQINVMEIDGVVSLLMADSAGTYAEKATILTVNKDQFKMLERKGKE